MRERSKWTMIIMGKLNNLLGLPSYLNFSTHCQIVFGWVKEYDVLDPSYDFHWTGFQIFDHLYWWKTPLLASYPATYDWIEGAVRKANVKEMVLSSQTLICFFGSTIRLWNRYLGLLKQSRTNYMVAGRWLRNLYISVPLWHVTTLRAVKSNDKLKLWIGLSTGYVASWSHVAYILAQSWLPTARIFRA